KRHIANRTREAMAFNHSAYVQVLDCEEVKSPHEVKRQLVQLVVTGIGNLFLDAPDFKPSAVSASRAFLAACQITLRMRQFTQALRLVPWVRDAFSRGQRRQ